MQPSHNPNLTNTTAKTTFPISRPNNNEVTYTFNTDPSRPDVMHITLPEGSTWTPSPHWHESYTEHLLVLHGRVKLILDGRARIVTPGDGRQVINRFVVHEWMRADRGADDDDDDKDEGDVVVEVWTDPADGVKIVFFHNLLGVLGDASRYWRGWTTLQIFLVCSAYDDYEVLVSPAWPKWVSYLVTHVVFLMVRVVAAGVGLSPWYEAYTPGELRDAALLGGRSRKGMVKDL